VLFFFSSRRRHTRFSRDWSSDVCSSDLQTRGGAPASRGGRLLLRGAVSFDRRRIRFRSSNDFAGLRPRAGGKRVSAESGPGHLEASSIGIRSKWRQSRRFGAEPRRLDKTPYFASGIADVSLAADDLVATPRRPA